MKKEEVQKLAELARIAISESEAENLTHEFASILQYVSEVKISQRTSNKTQDTNGPAVHNVFREDTDPHESGIYTEAVLNNAPSRKGDYIVVKKIL